MAALSMSGDRVYKTVTTTTSTITVTSSDANPVGWLDVSGHPHTKCGLWLVRMVKYPWRPSSAAKENYLSCLLVEHVADRMFNSVCEWNLKIFHDRRVEFVFAILTETEKENAAS